MGLADRVQRKKVKFWPKRKEALAHSAIRYQDLREGPRQAHTVHVSNLTHVWGKDMWGKGNLDMWDPPMCEESPQASQFSYESPFRTMKCDK